MPRSWLLCLLLLQLCWFSCGASDLAAQATNGEFRRGDCFTDGRVDLADATFAFSYLVNSQPPIICEDSCDADDNGIINLSDPMAILSYLYLDGPLPAPVGECAGDPTADSLGCDVGCSPLDPVGPSPLHLIFLEQFGNNPDIVSSRICINTPDSLSGWAFGICHDSTFLEIDQLDEGNALNNTGGPEFLAYEIYPEGFTAAVVISFDGSAVLPGGSFREIHRVEYTIPTPGISTICPCSTLGDPQVVTNFITDQNEPIIPMATCRTIDTLPFSIDFSRGDCNGSGTFDIADAVVLLDLLFGGGGAVFCRDACDINDDGALDISDPIYWLTYLFSSGDAPPAPSPGICGDDPSADSLDCDFSPCP
ncbi:MAG TPA: hypothetical protein EYN79_09020 [Planctomycetes bacterium]|nr:hypothetical protein [Planctomycetota bacterium]HIN80733.1 hypothetical protein [Planctomycetota bacterium]